MNVLEELKQPSPETENKTDWEITRERWIQEGFLIPVKKKDKPLMTSLYGGKFFIKKHQPTPIFV